jgi:hypothetical protein
MIMYEPAFYVDAAAVAAAAAPAAAATATDAPAAAATAVAATMLLLLLTAVCDISCTACGFIEYNKSVHEHGDLSTDHYSYNTQQ